ncbi:MAG: transcriptional initiation protein Tat [Wenzhouxiangellaceae bacterium]|nr:transcriptional initiation protein Tat [Wenzhouxiangellaceae bacterium]
MTRRKTSKPNAVNESRRKLLGTTLGIGAVASLGGLTTLKSGAAPVQAQPAQAEKRGYRETEHILRYYRSTAL